MTNSTTSQKTLAIRSQKRSVTRPSVAIAPIERLLWTKEEASAAINIPLEFLDVFIYRRHLQTVKLGNLIRIDPADVRSLVEKIADGTIK